MYGLSLFPFLTVWEPQGIPKSSIPHYGHCLASTSTFHTRTDIGSSEAVGDSVSNTTATSALNSFALPANCFNELLVVVDMAVERPQRRARANLTAQNLCLDPPREDCANLVAHECASWDREYVIEFLLLLMVSKGRGS